MYLIYFPFIASFHAANVMFYVSYALYSGEFQLGGMCEWQYSGTTQIRDAATLLILPTGRIVVSTGSILINEGVLENRGRFDVRLQPPALFTAAGGGFLNHGMVTMDSVPPSTLVMSGDLSNRGYVTVAEGNTIQFSGGNYSDIDQGYLRVDGGIAEVTGAECVTNLTSEKATIKVTSGSLVLTSSDEAATVEISGGVLSAENLRETLVYGHIIMTGGALNLVGELNLVNFTMEGGTVSGPGSLVIENEWNWVGGDVPVIPQGNIVVRGRLRLESFSPKILGKHLILEGDSTWIDTHLSLIIQSRFTIASGVTLQVFVNTIVFSGADGVIENNGLVNITLLSGLCAFHVNLHNFGDVLVDGGHVLIGGPMVNEGTLLLGNYSEMVIFNSKQSLTAANVQTKNGTIKVND